MRKELSILLSICAQAGAADPTSSSSSMRSQAVTISACIVSRVTQHQCCCMGVFYKHARQISAQALPSSCDKFSQPLIIPGAQRSGTACSARR